MKRLFLLISFILVGMAGAHAVSAFPHKIAVQTDDGTVFIRLFGDEYCHWAETEDGYTIVQDSTNRWCYAVTDSDGGLKASSCRVKAVANAQTQAFVNSHSPHLRPSSDYFREVRAMRSQRFPVSERSTVAGTRSPRAPVTGERRMLVILMAFSNVPFTKTVDDFDRMFNQEGYRADGAQGSVRDFYDAASYGQLQLVCDVVGPFTAKHEMAYYGKNEGKNHNARAYELFKEAVETAAKQVTLSDYDGDNDGYVDNVHIVFAGFGEEFGADADAIWSHKSSFYSPLVIQNMKIGQYSCSPELRGTSGKGISRIGVHCHEIGHALGAADYYDTDKEEGGYFPGTGEWDVMASGSHNSSGVLPADFNPYVKAFDFGWVTPKVLPKGPVTLLPSNDSPDSYYILQSKADGDFYLLENRQQKGWGMAVPGAGLLIFHIHQNIERAGNSINATYPQMCYPVCASSHYALPADTPESYGEEKRINSLGCPFPGFTHNTTFNANSTPAAFWWTGDPCNIDLSEIEQHIDYTVTLVNNSEGGYVEPGGGDDEVITLFYENFEGALQVAPLQNLWEVTMTGTNGISAYEGNRFFLLSAKKAYLQSVEDAFELNCSAMRPDGQVKVTGYYLSDGLKGRTNTVKIGYLPGGKTSQNGGTKEDDDKWVYETFTSSKNGAWQQFEALLPSGIGPVLRIEGTAVPLSCLAIDEIEVVQTVAQQDTEALTTVIANRQQETTYYSLSGRKLHHPSRGVYLQRLPDGSFCKKVMK